MNGIKMKNINIIWTLIVSYIFFEYVAYFNHYNITPFNYAKCAFLPFFNLIISHWIISICCTLMLFIGFVVTETALFMYSI